MALAGAPIGRREVETHYTEELEVAEGAPFPWGILAVAILVLAGTAIVYLLTRGASVAGATAILSEFVVAAIALGPLLTFYADVKRVLRQAKSVRAKAVSRIDGPSDGCREEQRAVSDTRRELDDLLSERGTQPWKIVAEGCGYTIGAVGVSGLALSLSNGVLGGALLLIEFAGAIGIAGFFGKNLAYIDLRLRIAKKEANQAVDDFDKCIEKKRRGGHAGRPPS